MLHVVNKSPFERNSLDSCLRLAKAGSAILLIEDGVYAALKGAATEDQLKAATGEYSVYVLGPDLKARGMSEERVVEGIQVVDYGGFVDLTAENDKVISWL